MGQAAPVKLRPLDEIIDHLFGPSEGDRAVGALFRMDMTTKSLHLLASSLVKGLIAGPSGNFSAIAWGEPIKICCVASRKQKEG